MTEIDDIDIIEMYTDFNESRNEFKMQQDDDQYDLKSEAEKNVTRKMGFLGSISEKKKSLEDIFKLDIKDNHKEL